MVLKSKSEIPGNDELNTLDILELLEEVDRTSVRLQVGLNQWQGWREGNRANEILAIRKKLAGCIATIRRSDRGLYVDH